MESTWEALEARTSRLPRSRGASGDAPHWGELLAGGRGCLASVPARLQREKTGLPDHPQEGALAGRVGGYMKGKNTLSRHIIYVPFVVCMMLVTI